MDHNNRIDCLQLQKNGLKNVKTVRKVPIKELVKREIQVIT